MGGHHRLLRQGQGICVRMERHRSQGCRSQGCWVERAQRLEI